MSLFGINILDRDILTGERFSLSGHLFRQWKNLCLFVDNRAEFLYSESAKFQRKNPAGNRPPFDGEKRPIFL